MSTRTYELTVDGDCAGTVDEDGLVEWMSENFEPECLAVGYLRRLAVGQSYGEEGMHAASFLVRRAA